MMHPGHGRPPSQSSTDSEQTTAGGPADPGFDSDFRLLLDEPEIRLLMQADGVDTPKLILDLEALATVIKAHSSPSVVLSARPKLEGSDSGAQETDYRAGVGILLLNRAGQAFIARRADLPWDAWQMPQSGIDGEESPREAALRELREEIGTDHALIIGESKSWFYYDVPRDVAQRAWRGKWKGQRQKWFLMLFQGNDRDINVATEHPEFNGWRWAAPDELADLAAPFKRQLYTDVLGEFSTVFRD